MKIAVLSNVNLDMLLATLGKEQEVFSAEGYGQWVSYALAENKDLTTFAPKLIFLWLDGNALLENCASWQQAETEIANNISYVKQMTTHYFNSTIVATTIDCRPAAVGVLAQDGLANKAMAKWREELYSAAAETNNLLPLDLANIIANEGRNKIYDDKLWYMGSIPYGIKSISVFAQAINELIAKFSMTRKKVLVVDLDNTLWGGVVGEDGPLGVELGTSKVGAAYRDAQKRIKAIRDTGILLAVVSKNNPAEVHEIFTTNPCMVLHEDDFVIIKNNWQQKFENIKSLATELNLGLDSFVFLDDNNVEREAVKINLPMVNVPNFPKNVADLPKTIEKIYNDYFWCARQTAEDVDRTKQYQQETARKIAQQAAGTIEDYLKSLEIKIDLCEVKDEQIERTVQLLNKTNQFNTNTVRMDKQEFLNYRNNPDNHVYVANVADKYGDSGLVVELLAHKDGNSLVIDNFLMSCRVMTRQIENAVVAAVADKAKEMGLSSVKASYIKTAKNKPVEDLWEKLGLKLIKQDGEDKYYEVALPYTIKPLLGVIWG